jgi:hypothetical protein
MVLIMATKNDERILMLKKQIEEKKQELGKQPRFSPVTTCLLNYNGSRINLHTLTSVGDINPILVWLNTYVLSAKDLDINCEDIVFDGFCVTDWIDDLISKKAVVEYSKKKEQLTALEKKLDKLLSDDKKTELEIDAIANLIGD